MKFIPLFFGILLAASTMAHAAEISPPDASRFVSNVKGIVLAPLTTLPAAPQQPQSDGSYDCSREIAVAPTTDAGKAVAKRGWIVASEARLGRYQAVSFASSCELAAGGYRSTVNGNVGIFDGHQLVALLYAQRSFEDSLGHLELLENGALLVRDGNTPHSPIGELWLDGNGLSFRQVADSRTYCHGRAVVPNVTGKSIRTARAILIKHGWTPAPPSEPPDADDAAAQLAKRGLVEAQGCSGTGLGFCGFQYRNAAGTLNVTTAGGDWEDGTPDIVVDYSVKCR